MADKRIIMVGDGYIIGMLKFCLMENDQIELIEVSTDCCDRLIEIIEQEKPDTIVIDQSLEAQIYLEKLLLVAKNHHINLVEVNANDNTIQVIKWHQIHLEDVRDFLAVL
jgi:hypothetical protein